MSRRLAPFALALPLFGLGCSSGSHGDLPEPFPEKPIASLGEYPEGPYGVTKGATIRDYRFDGWVDPSIDTTTFHTVALSDFYNPTGDGVYPEGSPYGAGEPLPKALFIDVSSSWCGPCQIEASETLPTKYAELGPKGTEFILQLADGPTPGTPATEGDLRAWTNKFDVDYPSTLDAAAQLSALYNAGSFPANVIIRTSTMEIVEVVNGAPEDGFWSTLEAVLDAP